MNLKKITEIFLSPFAGEDCTSGIKPYLLLELQVMSILCEIKNKINWAQKIKSDEIRSSWIQELSAEFSHIVIKSAFDELDRCVDKISEGEVLPGPVDRTYTSDTIIPLNLQNDLINQAKKLENVPEEDLDWHPGSKKQVLDLVHPSLFPVIFGETRAIANSVEPNEVECWKSAIGTGKVENVKSKSPKDFQIYLPFFIENSQESNYYSYKYQWLPSEVEIDSKGKAKIVSYINNLHPDIHQELYTTIEKIFERIIPLIQNTLTDCISTTIDNLSPRLNKDNYYNESFNDFVNRVCTPESLLTDEESI
ncbi:hypothetical protein AYI69_g11007 [Smittium culicis]|uniref:Uncharacterized protein n=1 Tax=Smittium culicis TaxID=133412 RepID=A0A1R1X1W5_9FUNG|nr:hypothetical protein AYI69_g11007 [Smittium culicis]